MTRSAPRVNGRFAIHMTKCRPLHPEMPCEICREDPGARMAAGRSDRRKRGRTRACVLPIPQIWGLNSIPRPWQHMLHMDARKPILRTPTEALDQAVLPRSCPTRKRPAASLPDASSSVSVSSTPGGELQVTGCLAALRSLEHREHVSLPAARWRQGPGAGA